MEMHQLRYFLAISEERNFTRAAEKSFVSQPSLSAQIIKLEDELGNRLFNRLGRRVELTSVGKQFEKRARSILMEADNAVREIRESASDFKGNLRIGVTPTVAPFLLPPVLKTCCERFPELRIRVDENLRRALLENLVSGNLDVVISSYSGGVSQVDAEPIIQEKLNLVIPRGHVLANREDISIEDFKDEPLIVLGESSALGAKVMEFFERNDFEPKTAAYCSQVSTAVALVHSGLGLAILPEMARESILPCGVVFKSMKSLKMSRLLFALTHERRYLPSGARGFLDVVREFVDGKG